MLRAVARAFGRDLHGALLDDVRNSRLVPSPPGPVVTEDDLRAFPAVVQRYFRAMNVLGRSRARSFTTHLTGKFRMRPGQRQMPCETWQWNSVDPVARLFHMRIDFAGIIPMVGRDAYVSGHGSMRGKLIGVVTVADGSGEEFDIGELTTWLNDAVIMCPSMLLDPTVSFEPIDDREFTVSCSDAGRTVTARVVLDDDGYPVDFRTTDRFADLPGGLRRAEWSTPLSGWRVVAGRAVPSYGSAVWKLDEGDLAYLEFTFGDDAIDLDPGLLAEGRD